MQPIMRDCESAGTTRHNIDHRLPVMAVKLNLEEKKKKNVTTFKYLMSMFDAEGGSTTDCENTVRLAWNKWREVTGVICDKKVPVTLKHKIYKTVIKAAMTYGAECWTMKKKDEMRLMNKKEMRMLRWIQGVSLRATKEMKRSGKQQQLSR